MKNIFQACSEGFNSYFQKVKFLYLVWIKIYRQYKLSIFPCNVDNFWSAQDIKIAPSGNTNWSLLNILAKYFSIIRNYTLSVFFRKESTIFTTKTRFSNEFSQHYWQQPFDGDSFVSQLRFDAYAIGRNDSMVIPLLANQDTTPMLKLPKAPWRSTLISHKHRAYKDT